jgi:predicted nuclease of predicted toxin-antitoxin system
MSIPLYMDHHVKAAITDGLRRRGVDVLTCADDGADQSDDDAILERAAHLARAVFTQDDDFLALADEWLRNGRDFAGVIYAEQMGITIGQAIRDLELIAKVMMPSEMRNRIEFLPYS